MPSFQVDDLDIDSDEFVYACNKREIKELIDTLVEEGHISKADVITGTDNHKGLTPSDTIFYRSLDSIARNRLQLTVEEEEMINKLGEKFKYL
jgi:hypothetical protein